MSNHPLVCFSLGDGTPPRVDFGYLGIIDGVPWLAATIEDAKAGTIANMHRLDQQQLEVKTDHDTGRQFFLYQGVLHESQSTS